MWPWKLRRSSFLLTPADNRRISTARACQITGKGTTRRYPLRHGAWQIEPASWIKPAHFKGHCKGQSLSLSDTTLQRQCFGCIQTICHAAHSTHENINNGAYLFLVMDLVLAGSCVDVLQATAARGLGCRSLCLTCMRCHVSAKGRLHLTGLLRFRRGQKEACGRFAIASKGKYTGWLAQCGLPSCMVHPVSVKPLSGWPTAYVLMTDIPTTA